MPQYPLQVDLVEPVEHFLEAAKRNLAQGYPDAGHGMSDEQEESSRHRAVNFFLTPLQVCGLAEGVAGWVWMQDFLSC